MVESELVDLGALEEAAREAESRPLRQSDIQVLTYRPTSDALPEQLVWPGTIAVFVARKGSRTLGRIRKAVESPKGYDRELAEALRAQSKGRRRVSLKRAVYALRKQAVFADVRYAKATVARNLYVPEGADFAAAILPYNGGRLARSGFSLVEYYNDSESVLEAVAVRHVPPLTAAEKAALDKVPPNQLEMNVGSAAGCFALCLVAVAVLVTLAAICGYDLTAFQESAARHVPDEKIRKLGPAATARELLKLRREMLVLK